MHDNTFSTKAFFVLTIFVLHEKANSIAIFWAGRSHLLGSCHFRGVWATCLPPKGGDVPLSALPKDTTSELADLFSQHFLNAERQAGKLCIPLLKVLWYDSTRGMNPRSTDCKADALTTTPLRRSVRKKQALKMCKRLESLYLFLYFSVHEN